MSEKASSSRFPAVSAHVPDGKISVNKPANRVNHLRSGGGLFSGYVAVKVIEVKIDALEKKVDKIYSDIYRPVMPRP